MKKMLFVLALVFTFSVNAQDSSDFKSKTIEFIKLTGSAQMFDDAISQIGMMVPEDKKEAYTKEAQGTLNDLYSELANIYIKEFTEAEIDELIEFYNSEIGQKLASKQTAITQSGMAVGQNWGMSLSQIAQKYSN